MARKMKIGANPQANARLSLQVAVDSTDNAEEKAFLSALLKSLDFESYSDLQKWHLAARSKPAKFLDLCAWMRHKFALAKSMCLDSQEPKRILDIGCGPSHFGLVAKHMGHEVIGLDLPANALYGDLNDFFNLRRFVHPVRAMRPLPADLDTFDIITALSANFYQKEDDTLFTIKEWRFFMSNIVRDHLNPGGTILFNLNPLPDHHGMHFWDDAFVAMMESAGGTVNRKTGFVNFPDASGWL